MIEIQQGQGVAALGALIFIIGFIVWAIISSRKREEREAALAVRELAIIVEHVTMTGGGAICVILLLLTLAGSFFSLIAATTVFQQIEAGVFLLAGCVLFGLGIALGHKRTYRVYRSEHRDPM